MSKLPLTFSGLSILLASGAIAMACGGGGETTTDAGLGGASTGGGFSSTGGSSNTGGGPSTGGGLATGGSTTGGAGNSAFDMKCKSVACISDGLIDDFADNDQEIASANGTTGYWYTYASPVAGVDITPIATAIAGGKITVVASGLSSKDSASFGADLNQLSGTGCGADASTFAGVRVVGANLGAAGAKIQVRAVMPEVVAVADGGLCTADCWDAHFKEITLPQTSGEVLIPWADFAQNPYFGTDLPLDPARITQIQFAQAAGATGFNVEIDEVGFYGAGSGTCGLGGAGGI